MDYDKGMKSLFTGFGLYFLGMCLYFVYKATQSLPVGVCCSALHVASIVYEIRGLVLIHRD
jgi:hypothetical protein